MGCDVTDSTDVTVGVGSTTIAVRAEDPALADRVVEMLADSGFRQVEGVPRPSGQLVVRQLDGPVAPPDGAEEVAAHRSIRVFRGDGGRLLLDDARSRMVLDPEEGALEAALAPELRDRPLRDERFLLVLYGVLTFLRYRELYPLHAGAVERDGAGCLLIGASGSGKSSMAVQLVRRGWGYVADDSVALQRIGDGRLTAIGMRRDAYLREADGDNMEREGWRECHEFHPIKYRIPVREAYPDRCRDAVVPHAIVFPSLTHREGSRWIRSEPHDALFSLLEHSSVSELEPSRTPEHVQVLRDLVVQARCYRLLAGLDLRNNPAALSDLVDDILRDATGGKRQGA